MTLQIRNPRAHDLARELASKRKVSMTEAVMQALENELKREKEQQPLAARIARIAADLAAQSGSRRRTIGKRQADVDGDLG